MRNLVYYFKEGSFLFSEKWLQHIQGLQKDACISDKTLCVFSIPNHNGKVNAVLVAKIENAINGVSDIDSYIAQNEKLTTSLRYFEAANKSDAMIIEALKKEIKELKEVRKEAKIFESKYIKAEKKYSTLQSETATVRNENKFLKQEISKEVTDSSMYIALNAKLNKCCVELSQFKKENATLKANYQLLINK